MARRPAPLSSETVLVVGLGRFGGALAMTLENEMGHEVLAIDSREDVVQQFARKITHVVSGDATDVETLAQIGAEGLHHAVVAIGDGVESSILATAALVDLGITNIWAKAVTEAHAQILERVGAHHIVFPERDMGQRVAHQVTGQMVDYMRLDEGFALVERSVPQAVAGMTLAEGSLRQRYDVTVVCIKPAGGTFTYATPDSVLDADALLLVAGELASVDRFAEEA
jgi:trk system potassium uptake protein TrkA